MYKWTLGIINLGILVASGCGVTPDDQESDVEQALSTDFTDTTGTVTVRITQCPATGFNEVNTTSCSVDTGFVLIGGGAEILGEGSPGALLTASFPDAGLRIWTASSKDHHLAFPHQLRAYAVGLKLAGVAESTLRNTFMTVVSLRSTPAEHPSISLGVPGGFNLVGGGARANWVTEGQLLTRSFPSGPSLGGFTSSASARIIWAMASSSGAMWTTVAVRRSTRTSTVSPVLMAPVLSDGMENLTNTPPEMTRMTGRPSSTRAPSCG